MHVDAIEEALAQGDCPAVEAAFLALISFPRGDRIVGVKTVERLCSLLSRVTQALHDDESAIPPAVGEIILAVLSEPTGIVGTYAGAAKSVSDHQYRWRGRYLEYAVNGGSLE